ncbi:MAPEG family protein [Thalassomonas sp. M1454]|uniref:MAPEG family protein n=1 Tax=Thalassomonas sp. M1454 TaxID=2594477 RepID=UPI00117C11C9|nr:MAPEG family protein [Thalassomonas sp. M1454]TRX54475.1 hypothetical protein FNN08_12145 [Thalassomonas sp. M1454]
MTIAYWCVLASCLLPLLAVGYAKFLSSDSDPKNYDNNNPRDYLAKLKGDGQRALWAEKNTLEAMPLFFAAVIIAHNTGADQATLDALAISFIGFRLLYIYLYISDKATLRSLSWFAGLACCVAMFIISA